MSEIDLKQETKLLSALNKLFEDNKNEQATDESCKVVDKTSVIYAETKTDEAKKILNRFVDKEREPLKINIDYTTTSDGLQEVKLNANYLSLILNVLKITNEGVKITAKNDTPLMLENEHFKFIIANRVGDY